MRNSFHVRKDLFLVKEPKIKFLARIGAKYAKTLVFSIRSSTTAQSETQADILTYNFSTSEQKILQTVFF
jgi:hypothetical protein